MQPLQPSRLPVPTASFVPGLKSGPFVFVSGQVAIDADGKAAHPGDVGAQTAQVVQQIRWIVEEAGGSLADIVKTTVYLTDFTGYRDFDAAYTAAFGDHKPAREVVSAALLRPGLAIEMSAIAMLA